MHVKLLCALMFCKLHCCVHLCELLATSKGATELDTNLEEKLVPISIRRVNNSPVLAEGFGPTCPGSAYRHLATAEDADIVLPQNSVVDCGNSVIGVCDFTAQSARGPPWQLHPLPLTIPRALYVKWGMPRARYYFAKCPCKLF